MALNLYATFSNMVRQFRTNESDDRFQADFVDAVNNSLDKLSFSADLATAMTHITSFDQSADDLSADDQSILMRVVPFELLMMGRKHVRGDSAFAELGSQSEVALGDFMVKQSRDLQASVADNLSGEGEDIIGLGDVTEASSTGTDSLNGE